MSKMLRIRTTNIQNTTGHAVHHLGSREEEDSYYMNLMVDILWHLQAATLTYPYLHTDTYMTKNNKNKAFIHDQK